MQQQICAFAAKICALCRVRLVLCGEKCLQLQKCNLPSQCLLQQKRTLPSQASPMRREISESFAARNVCSNKGALCRLKRVLCGEKCLQQQRRTLPSQASPLRREVFAATKAHFAVSSESFPARSVCSYKGALCRLKRAVCGEKCLQPERWKCDSDRQR